MTCLQFRKSDVESVPSSGPADGAVSELVKVPRIAKQLAQVDPDELRRYLKEFGAWDVDELADHDANLARVVWIATGDLRENWSPYGGWLMSH